MSTALTPASVRRAPKVLLHDHLDGGLRPSTVIELADAAGYPELPSTDPAELGEWFAAAADSGSLVRYLETFAHTCGVMQTGEAQFRVAAEAAQDLAADGVVYAEVRYAPELFTEHGMGLDEIVETVQAGFREGERLAAAAGHQIRIGTLLCAMRQNARSMEIAELAVRNPDGTAELGRLAGYVRDRRIPLEMCPSSNVQTGATTSIAEHPIGLLSKLRFRVTVNTDNRLMSHCSMSSEFLKLSEAFGYGWPELQWFTINAMKSAFITFDERLEIINRVIKPG